jgi:hypothetical protein
MRQRKSQLTALAVLFFAGLTSLTFAQMTLPASRLHKMKARTAGPKEPIAQAATHAAAAATLAPLSVAGVDSVVNWSDQFTAPGFDANGNPQSVWPYTMVGNSPDSGIPAIINAPIVPVTVDLLGPDGKVAFTTRPGSDIVNGVLGSPMFQPFI